LPETRLVGHSDLYASAPVGPQDQPDFINAVAALETTLAPLALLDALQQLENAAGRERHRHWGERTLDLDILLWDQRTLDLPRLTVPHPELTRRAFVIGPLLDLLPDCRLPDGTPVADYWPAVAAQPLQRLHCLEENHFADRTH
ncbi:MAG: 2-amino-4-hydroxy-6-hydroxymethyldihydropteridine diphosphokinase, partial [Alloalcanivorax venustensis]